MPCLLLSLCRSSRPPTQSLNLGLWRKDPCETYWLTSEGWVLQRESVWLVQEWLGTRGRPYWELRSPGAEDADSAVAITDTMTLVRYYQKFPRQIPQQSLDGPEKVMKPQRRCSSHTLEHWSNIWQKFWPNLTRSSLGILGLEIFIQACLVAYSSVPLPWLLVARAKILSSFPQAGLASGGALASTRLPFCSSPWKKETDRHVYSDS